MFKKLKNKKGFTMIELLAAMVILGILMGIAVPSITNNITGTRNKTYVSDALKLISNAEYQFRKDNTLEKPTTTRCVVMSLVYLNNGVFDEAPNGGEYIRNKSFVVAIQNSSTGDTDYYVRLVEDRGDSEYRGIDFMTKTQLQASNAFNEVVNISGSDLYGIAGTSESTLLSKIRTKISACSSLYIYAPNSGDA